MGGVGLELLGPACPQGQCRPRLAVTRGAGAALCEGMLVYYLARPAAAARPGGAGDECSAPAVSNQTGPADDD